MEASDDGEVEDQVEHPDQETRPIALCLSGGGLRAAWFHAGLLLALQETGRLGEVERIFSVSGGSITTALSVARWEGLAGGDPATWERFIQDLQAFNDREIRTRISRRYWRWFWGGTGTALVSEYQSLLSSLGLSDALPSAPSAPCVHMLATELVDACPVVLTAEGWVRLTGLRSPHKRQIPPWQTSVASLPEAMAASSAFPLLVGPVKPQGFRVSLSDGGILDNTAAYHALQLIDYIELSEQAFKQKVRTFRVANFSRTSHLVLCSDAGLPFSAKDESSWLPSYWATRTTVDATADALQNRQLEQARDEFSDFHRIRIRDPLPDGALNRELSELLSRIRTDLDGFPPEICKALVLHGYQHGLAALDAEHSDGELARTVCASFDSDSPMSVDAEPLRRRLTSHAGMWAWRAVIPAGDDLWGTVVAWSFPLAALAVLLLAWWMQSGNVTVFDEETMHRYANETECRLRRVDRTVHTVASRLFANKAIETGNRTGTAHLDYVIADEIGRVKEDLPLHHIDRNLGLTFRGTYDQLVGYNDLNNDWGRALVRTGRDTISLVHKPIRCEWMRPAEVDPTYLKYIYMGFEDSVVIAPGNVGRLNASRPRYLPTTRPWYKWAKDANDGAGKIADNVVWTGPYEGVQKASQFVTATYFHKRAWVSADITAVAMNRLLEPKGFDNVGAILVDEIGCVRAWSDRAIGLKDKIVAAQNCKGGAYGDVEDSSVNPLLLEGGLELKSTDIYVNPINYPVGWRLVAFVGGD